MNRLGSDHLTVIKQCLDAFNTPCENLENDYMIKIDSFMQDINVLDIDHFQKEVLITEKIVEEKEILRKTMRTTRLINEAVYEIYNELVCRTMESVGTLKNIENIINKEV